MSQRKWISILSVLAVIGIGVGVMLLLTSFKADVSVVVEDPPARLVRTQPLVAEVQELSIHVDGFLKAGRSVDLQVPVAGQVAFVQDGLKGGVTVDQGTLLLALDSRRAENAYHAAKMALLRASSSFGAQAGLQGDELNQWNRYLSLLEAEGFQDIPEPPVGNGRRRILAATMGVLDAWYAVDRAAMDLADHHLRAPFSGTLSGDGVSEGAWISPGIPLATLTESAALELSLDVPADDVAKILPGQGVVISIPGQTDVLAGRVLRVEALLTSGSQTGRIHTGGFRGDPRIWMPGTYVEAQVSISRLDAAYRVPRSLLNNGSLPLYDDGVLRMAPVQVLDYQDDDALLAPTFAEGTEMVVTQILTPIEGMPIRREVE